MSGCRTAIAGGYLCGSKREDLMCSRGPGRSEVIADGLLLSHGVPGRMLLESGEPNSCAATIAGGLTTSCLFGTEKPGVTR